MATAGVHRDAHYPDGHWVHALPEEHLARLLIAEIETGQPTSDDEPPVEEDRTSVRAGMLKAGIDYWWFTAAERRVIAAVAIAHVASGAPVMIHLEHGSAAHEVLDVLEADGVALDAVVLAHIDRAPDPVLHAELAARGAYLGYDGFARTRDRTDAELLDCLEKAADRGARDRILIGGDVARRHRYEAYGGMPGLAYLGRRVIPRLRAAGRDDLVDAALVHNPAALLSRFTSPGKVTR